MCHVHKESRKKKNSKEIVNQKVLEPLKKKEKKITTTWGYLKQIQTSADNGEKKRKMYIRRTSKLLETNLCCRNPIKEINTWAVFLVRSLEPFLKRIMHKVFHPRDDIYRLCVKKRRRKKNRHRWCIITRITVKRANRESAANNNSGQIVTGKG